MQGYIKLYRKLMESPVWGDPFYLKLWMYCLMKATHKEREFILGSQFVTLEPGQFITGRNTLADDLNKGMKPKQKLSEKTWYRYLENLEKWQMLTIKKTNKYSVISILKWGEYQDSDQQLSNKSPSDVPQLSTNKNVKNVNNDKKIEEEERNEDPFYLFENNICRLNEINRHSLIDWCSDLGDELVVAAIKLAAKYNARTYAYFEDILKEWHRNNVTTIDDARVFVKENGRRKNNVVNFSTKKAGNGVDWDNL